MSSGSPGRASHWQHTHYLRRTFDYNTSGFTTAAVGWVGALPPGAIVRGTMVKVHTAFNSATSDVIDVGTTADDDAFVDGADLQATGGQYAITGMDWAMDSTNATDVWAQLTSVGTPSAGSVTVIVEYFPNNDQ
jgi:hypothetical protein